MAEFVNHGLIECRRSCLLKGVSIESTIKLDDYCALVPYRDVVEDLRAEQVFGLTDKWPEAGTSVCVLEATEFTNRLVGSLEELGMIYGSPLLKQGPEHLALLLSVVWGYGLNFFMSRDRVPPAVAAVPQSS